MGVQLTPEAACSGDGMNLGSDDLLGGRLLPQLPGLPRLLA